MFWVWWSLTCLVIAEQLIRAWNHQKELLAFPTFASVMWGYIYVYLPYALMASNSSLFSPQDWAFYQLTAFIGIFSLNVGWRITFLGRMRKHISTVPAQYNLNKLRDAAIAFSLVGILGFQSFLQSTTGYQGASGYWYLLFLTCYPGVSICVALMTLSPSFRKPAMIATLVVVGILLFYPLLSRTRRGPTYAGIIAVVSAYAAVQARPPRVLVLSSLACTGLLLLVLVTLRTSGSGDLWHGKISLDGAITKRASTLNDNEYYNHCQMIGANLRTGLYQYGTVHLGVLLNWIPRQVWLNKPGRSVGFYPEAFKTIKGSEKSNLGFGGSWGPVADAFNNYWYFFPIFFLGLGVLTAYVFHRAMDSNALNWKMHNVGLLCASHWFVAQCFSEAAVPALIFQGVFYVAFRYARDETRTGRAIR